MPGILSERIAALRKERGLTQEQLGKMVGVSSQAVGKWEKGGAPDVELLPVLSRQLGVTIDALFGLDGGEQINIEDTVYRWMLTVPHNRRVDRLCRLVWSAAGAVMSSKLEDVIDVSDYLSCCETVVNPENGERWLRRTRIMMEDGTILGVRADDMSFAAIFPEPEAGWERFLPDNAFCRRLFEALARPHCLELLEYLHSKPPLMRRYTPGAIAKPMGLDTAEAAALMEALAELDVLSKVDLETEDGIINAYLLDGEEALVPFLYLAR